MVKPDCLNFRIITGTFFGVQMFWIFTIHETKKKDFGVFTVTCLERDGSVGQDFFFFFVNSNNWDTYFCCHCTCV